MTFDDDAPQSVFVYGSNLDEARMRRRCPSAGGRRRGRLLGHRLVFDRIAVERDGTGYANVVPDEEGVVEGALYEMVRDDLLRLDGFEGHPAHCSRRLMAVDSEDGRVPAWVYVATPEWRAQGLRPREDQVSHLLAGRDVLSPEYVARLEMLISSS